VANKLAFPPAVFFAVRVEANVMGHTLCVMITKRNAQSRETHYTFVADVAGFATFAERFCDWF
jgi:hypothetical protein